MKRVTAILLAMALIVLMALPAFAQGTGGLIQIDLDEQNNSGISGTATLEDQGDGTTRVDLVLEGVEEKGAYPAHIHAGQCPEPGEITYPLESVVFNANAGAGVSVTILEASIDEILAVQSAINVHLYSDPSVYVACGNLQMAGGDKQVPDNQQNGEDKDAGAGDDQQDDGTGAGDDQQGGKTPDNQQSGGGKEMVTKTFELTLNGDVPAGETFYVVYAETDREAAEGTFLIFCGDAELINSEPSDVDCVGEGTVYTQEIAVPAGTEIFFSFGHVPDQGEGEGFHEGTETINADITNTAYYTFGKGTGAGDEQETPDNQQDGEKPDTGAGEVPDNQQDGEDKDSGAGDEQETPDDQQGEMPDELPDTGAGGLAGGLPLGSAAAGASLLAASAYGAIRRR